MKHYTDITVLVLGMVVGYVGMWVAVGVIYLLIK